MLRICSALLVLLFVSGCSSFPDTLKVSDESQLLTYQQVSAQPQASKDKPVRWGGAIAKVENKPDFTLLEIVHYPLRSYGRPIDDDESIGRFRVKIDGFLDPMVYEKGRLVTISGQVLGTEKGLVGEHEYVFPSISSSAYHLWKKVSQTRTSLHVWPYGYYSGFGWRYGPFGHRVILQQSITHSKAKSGIRRVGKPAGNGASRD